MAAYNAERYIRDSIGSVLDQTYRDWELLVVDDGSTDSTQAQVASFGDERIRVLSEPHVGVLAQVRNRGIAAARGEAIALLDSDDVWLEHKLARQVEVLGERSGVGLVHTAAAPLVDGNAGRALRVRTEPAFRRLLENNFLFSSSVLVRRAILDEYGPFDPDPVLDGSPDYDLWLRLAPRTEFAFIDEVSLLYRVHAQQMSTNRRAMALGALAALERAQSRDPELVARARASYRLGVARQRVLAGEGGPLRRLTVAASSRVLARIP